MSQQLHALFYFVALHFLCYEQLDAVLVIVAKHLHEGIGLVVLASEAQHEHSACVGMQANVAQHLARVLMVAAQL